MTDYKDDISISITIRLLFYYSFVISSFTELAFTKFQQAIIIL